MICSNQISLIALGVLFSISPDCCRNQGFPTFQGKREENIREYFTPSFNNTTNLWDYFLKLKVCVLLKTGLPLGEFKVKIHPLIILHKFVTINYFTFKCCNYLAFAETAALEILLYGFYLHLSIVLM